MQKLVIPGALCVAGLSLSPVSTSYVAMYRLWRSFLEERGWKWTDSRVKREFVYFVAWPATAVVGIVAWRRMFRWLRLFMLTPVNPRRTDAAMELRLWRARTRLERRGEMTGKLVWDSFGPGSTSEKGRLFFKDFGLDLFVGVISFGWAMATASLAQPFLELPFVVHVGGDQRETRRRRALVDEAEHRERRARIKDKVVATPSLAQVLERN